ncbi:stage V sporulation protein D (sporulation-specific penicillin-binding protein) [Natranaerovirga pectinivora]|uniref:Stage V sporulation protein D (Sporulation-specific penicillin-binding protein) n=2 Tax=Natranaerovirga pectinivora TaxID=682400 RepID=A0A4R3MT14_9FIRM|nr:stage V sporulation protein D (sporulation-specific penicillin-binding protein) [Natranaerovirga pectinivora]
MKKNLMGIFIVFVFIFLTLIGRLIYIKHFDGNQYERSVLAQQTSYNRILQFKRGSILDRNGTVLASSIKVFNLILDPEVLAISNDNSKETTVEILNEYFGINKDELLEYINNPRGRHYVPLIKHISFEDVEEFNGYLEEKRGTNLFRGVWFEEEYIRNYPFNNLASNVLGFYSSDVGRWGVEEYYNKELTGEIGREFGLINEGLYVQRETRNPKNGNNIITTIDYTIQHFVEQALTKFTNRVDTLNAMVIVMDPNSGEILAMASQPNYNPNHPMSLVDHFTEEGLKNLSSEERLNYLQRLWRLNPISDTYEPGSTFKPMTIAAALEEGILTGDEMFLCNGHIMVRGTRINCWRREGHGEQTLSQVLANSCNIGLVEIGEMMGREIFVQYQRGFGFGERTNIDLLGEASASNLLYSVNRMGPVELATNTFGQSFNVTPIQLITGFSAFLNGGELVEPHIVKQIVDENGYNIKSIDKKVVRKVISRDTADQVKEYLLDAVADGTGRRAYIEGYDIGGKTGTAEKLPRGNDKYIYSFIGFAPFESPEVVALVILDEPEIEGANSSLAISVFREIMEKVLPYMNIYPSESNIDTE